MSAPINDETHYFNQINTSADNATDKAIKSIPALITNQKELTVSCEMNGKNYRITIVFAKEVDLTKQLDAVQNIVKKHIAKALAAALVYKLGEPEENTQSITLSQNQDGTTALKRYINEYKNPKNEYAITKKQEIENGKKYYLIDDFNSYLDKKVESRKKFASEGLCCITSILEKMPTKS